MTQAYAHLLVGQKLQSVVGDVQLLHGTRRLFVLRRVSGSESDARIRVSYSCLTTPEIRTENKACFCPYPLKVNPGRVETTLSCHPFRGQVLLNSAVVAPKR